MKKEVDTTIQIADPSGQEVYSETRKGFSGAYSSQIDISRYGRGTFTVKISQNGKSVAKKIVVE